MRQAPLLLLLPLASTAFLAPLPFHRHDAAALTHSSASSPTARPLRSRAAGAADVLRMADSVSYGVEIYSAQYGFDNEWSSDVMGKVLSYKYGSDNRIALPPVGDWLVDDPNQRAQLSSRQGTPKSLKIDYAVRSDTYHPKIRTIIPEGSALVDGGWLRNRDEWKGKWVEFAPLHKSSEQPYAWDTQDGEIKAFHTADKTEALEGSFYINGINTSLDGLTRNSCWQSSTVFGSMTFRLWWTCNGCMRRLATTTATWSSRPCGITRRTRRETLCWLGTIFLMPSSRGLMCSRSTSRTSRILAATDSRT